MRSRKTIYSQISTIEQLRAERNSLEWHIKGIEDRFMDHMPSGFAKVHSQKAAAPCPGLLWSYLQPSRLIPSSVI